MRIKKNFSIAFKGLKAGVHHFEYNIDDNFFKAFESSPVKSGDIDVELDFHKRIDHFQIDISLKGTIASTCDRCTADINLPIEKNGSYLIKFSDENEEDIEVIYLGTKAQVFNASELIYETIILGIPLIKTFDCDEMEPMPCNQKVLDYLYDSDNEDTDEKKNPMWDKLNDLKFNDN